MPPTVSLSNAYESNITVQKIIGFWNSNNKWYNFYKKVIYFIMFLMPLSTIILLVVNRGKHIDRLFVLPAEFEAPVKFLFFCLHYPKILSLWTILESKHFQPKNSAQVIILNKMVNQSRFLQDQYFGWFFGVFIIALCPCFFRKDFELIIPIWVPFDYRQKPIYFYLVSGYLTIACFYWVYVSLVTDSFLYLSMVQIEAQFECISNTLENFSDFKGRSKRENLINCIEHYNYLLEYIKVLHDAFKENITAQVVVSVGSVCLTLYYMSQVSNK